LTFLSEKYPEDFETVKKVFDWFDSSLIIIPSETKPSGIAHLLDMNAKIKDFANKLIPSLNTGITKIEVEKEKINDLGVKNDIAIDEITEHLKTTPDTVSILLNRKTGGEVCFALEDGEVIAKRMVTNHINNTGNNVSFNMEQESDGTKRLIDYIPALESIIDDNRVYLIDEIEKSIHPITIKEIIKKLSLDENIKGQLIFTTHESNLLDQEILRPDEIWFAQKDRDGASRLYSLSDFKIHHTIDIENGYLDGRYGGIPFLSNLKDLNWE
jgi:AAA15 family ATPase/GTPase